MIDSPPRSPAAATLPPSFAGYFAGDDEAKARGLYQLVDDNTSVIWVGQGVAKNVEVDAAWLQDKYGVLPNRYVDFSVLRGDPSDGLPGVKGVGEKSAARLTEAFGSLEELVRAAAEGRGGITPAIRARIVDSTEYILKAEAVVAVVRDLPLTVPPLLPVRPDTARVNELAHRLGLAGPIGRLLQVCA